MASDHRPASKTTTRPAPVRRDLFAERWGGQHRRGHGQSTVEDTGVRAAVVGHNEYIGGRSPEVNLLVGQETGTQLDPVQGAQPVELFGRMGLTHQQQTGLWHCARHGRPGGGQQTESLVGTKESQNEGERLGSETEPVARFRPRENDRRQVEVDRHDTDGDGGSMRFHQLPGLLRVHDHGVSPTPPPDLVGKDFGLTTN